MNIELNNFKYWLNTGIGKINNREIIYEYYFKLINLISSLGLKTPNIKLKHEFIAYLYEHSKFSKIKTQIFKTYELPNDEFIVNHDSKLYVLKKKDILKEALRREILKRKQQIKDKLKSMNYEEKGEKNG